MRKRLRTHGFSIYSISFIFVFIVIYVHWLAGSCLCSPARPNLQLISSYCDERPNMIDLLCCKFKPRTFIIMRACLVTQWTDQTPKMVRNKRRVYKRTLNEKIKRRRRRNRAKVDNLSLTIVSDQLEANHLESNDGRLDSLAHQLFV